VVLGRTEPRAVAVLASAEVGTAISLDRYKAQHWPGRGAKRLRAGPALLLLSAYQDEIRRCTAKVAEGSAAGAVAARGSAAGVVAARDWAAGAAVARGSAAGAAAAPGSAAGMVEASNGSAVYIQGLRPAHWRHLTVLKCSG
jgi:hypothetical protein